MSLNYDLTNVKDCDTVCWENDKPPYEDNSFFGRARYITDDGKHKVMRAETQVLIFVSMSLGMPGITEANVNEFWARLRMHQGVFGPLLRKPGKKAGTFEEVPLTKEDVLRHVGLSVNVTYVGPKAWTKNFYAHVLRG